MRNQYFIRDAKPNDQPWLKEIIDLSFPRFFRYFASHSVSNLNELLIVSEHENKAVGFAKLTEFQIDDKKYGCILWIAVHPNYRRRGIALELTHKAVDCLKKRSNEAVFASTQRTNMAAQATLHKGGFEKVGFSGLWFLFGWRVFAFYRKIWYAPGEVVLANFFGPKVGVNLNT
ncbi:MAG: GNAT family N-acetyltransferase [Candidatus Bathyarchaeota archaeon]|nr:GNAT family N-acetyltransferase [Candidatus Bathyarchaeota archaeon]